MVEFSKLFKLGLNGTVKLLFSFLWPLNIEAGLLWGKWHPVMSHMNPPACHSEQCLLCSWILEYSMTVTAASGPCPNKWEAHLHKSHFHFIHPLPKSRSEYLISSMVGGHRNLKGIHGWRLERIGSREEFLLEIQSWNKRKPDARHRVRKRDQLKYKQGRNQNHHCVLLSLQMS